MSWPECVRAWLIAEGDVLDGQRVVSVQRDPAAERVVVATDGRRRTLYREDRLVMTYRLAADVTIRQGGVGAFLAGVRHWLATIIHAGRHAGAGWDWRGRWSSSSQGAFGSIP